MKIIQETAEIIIYRDLYLLTEVRFVKTKSTGVMHIFAEDLARVLGYRDVHEMIEADQVRDQINFAHLETGIYPMQTLNLEDADMLVGRLDETPLEKAEFFEENYGDYVHLNADEMAQTAIEMLVNGNPSIMGLELISCDVKTSDRLEITKEFAIRLKADESKEIFLTDECLQQMLGLLEDFKPAQ